MDTSFSYTGETAFFSSDERKWINKIHTLKEQFPDQVEIIQEPEDNNGCIYASLPARALKLSLYVRTLTEEQRAASAERFRLYREKE